MQAEKQLPFIDGFIYLSSDWHTQPGLLRAINNKAPKLHSMGKSFI